MRKTVVYIHGKGGNAGEAERYRQSFPECSVIGYDYRSETPWEAAEEFPAFFAALEADSLEIVANSIGAYFALNSLSRLKPEKAYFISPVVNMERLILDMLQWTGSTERELEEAGRIETSFGETLSWEYLSWVRAHPIRWDVPTEILYGGRDHLQSRDTVLCFAEEIHANVTVMEEGEHWFHTPEQLRFLDDWLLRIK